MIFTSSFTTLSFCKVPFVLVDSGTEKSTGMVHVKLHGAVQPLPLTTVYHKLVPVEQNPYTLFQTIVGNGYPVSSLLFYVETDIFF